jgi:multidrug efflux pump subunit AcrA (membrane-fusion protein)
MREHPQRVREGQENEFYLDSFPKDKYEGNVLSIARESILKEGVTVYEVKILPARLISVLRSGMTTDVKVITAVKAKALYLPRKAITYKDGDAFVTMKEEKNKKVTEKRVETGASNENTIEITSGVTENDTIYYSTGIPKERSAIQFN